MSTIKPDDRNSHVIEEFRQNDGEVGGVFAGTPLLLLHHTGARTGKARVTPLMYRNVDDGYAVFATKGGAPTHPDWYYNLIENPGAEIEIGARSENVIASVLASDDRDAVWEQQKQEFPAFAGYEAKTDREIPVVVLRPTG